MNLTSNKIQKNFIIILFFLLFLFPTFYLNSSPKNLLVEDLLDKLQKAETIIEAEIIRKKIWNKWIYQVPKNLQKNLNYALDEFYSGRLASAEKAFTDLINNCGYKEVSVKNIDFEKLYNSRFN